MGAHRNFLNQALLDQLHSVYRVRLSPDVNKDGRYLLLRRTVRQCVNKEIGRLPTSVIYRVALRVQ